MSSSRMILSVFKALATSIVLVFVLDMAFYLYKALNLNQRMESVCVSLQKVVTDNNYLPQGEYNMYKQIFNTMCVSLNGGTGSDLSSADQNFIRYYSAEEAVKINYTTDATDVPAETTNMTDSNGKALVHKKLSKPGDYGDIQVIEIKVRVVQPLWRFSGSRGALVASDWERYEAGTTDFTYSFLVPCLKYQSVTN